MPPTLKTRARVRYPARWSCTVVGRAQGFVVQEHGKDAVVRAGLHDKVDRYTWNAHRRLLQAWALKREPTFEHEAERVASGTRCRAFVVLDGAWGRDRRRRIPVATFSPASAEV